MTTNTINPFLWFDNQAEEAADYYVSIFKNGKVLSVTRYGDAAANASGRPKGSVMTVVFELEGVRFTALNGGPLFKFNESVSFVIDCETQNEIDHFWNKLSAGGNPKAQQCGWLKDKFGLSWQVVPKALGELLGKGDAAGTQRMIAALMQMKKLDIDALKTAYAG